MELSGWPLLGIDMVGSSLFIIPVNIVFGPWNLNSPDTFFYCVTLSATPLPNYARINSQSKKPKWFSIFLVWHFLLVQTNGGDKVVNNGTLHSNENSAQRIKSFIWDLWGENFIFRATFLCSADTTSPKPYKTLLLLPILCICDVTDNSVTWHLLLLSRKQCFYDDLCHVLIRLQSQSTFCSMSISWPRLVSLEKTSFRCIVSEGGRKTLL